MIPHKRFDIFPPDWGMLRRSKMRSDRFLRGNFSRKFWGWRGQKILGKKNTSLTKKISSGNVGSDSLSRGNFEAQNFLETRGKFTGKFWDHLIIEVKSVPFPSTG